MHSYAKLVEGDEGTGFPISPKTKVPSPKEVVVVRDKQDDDRYCFNLVVR